MHRFVVVAVAGLLAGCSEYNLIGGKDDEGTAGDAEANPPVGEDAPDQGSPPDGADQQADEGRDGPAGGVPALRGGLPFPGTEWPRDKGGPDVPPPEPNGPIGAPAGDTGDPDVPADDTPDTPADTGGPAETEEGAPAADTGASPRADTGTPPAADTGTPPAVDTGTPPEPTCDPSDETCDGVCDCDAEADADCAEDVCDTGCTYSRGYWRTHTEDWPVASLTLGDRTYTDAELVDLLGTPVAGDASLNLAHQLIAAKLTLAMGTRDDDIDPVIAAADAWLVANDDGDGLPLEVHSTSAAAAEATDLASELSTFNAGYGDLAHCGGTETM